MFSKSFCPLPWLHQATYTDGSILHCCVAQKTHDHNRNRATLSETWNSQSWKDLRRKMLAGEQPEACRRCWIEEDNGFRSHRVTELTVWQERLGPQGLQALVDRTKSDGHLDVQPMSLDLRIGNTCNLACVMCRPQDSSRWHGLAKKMESNAISESLKGDLEYKLKIDLKDFAWAEENDFWRELRELLPGLRELIIGGGEPMLLAKHPQFLEECVRSGHARHITLRYHTNLTHLPEDIIALWDDFELVEVFASIDGLGDKNTYVRHPAIWTEIEKNLRRLESLSFAKVRTMILYSVHFLSLHGLGEFLTWMQDQDFKTVMHRFNRYVHPGLVMDPKHLSIQVYPKAIKEGIRHRLLNFETTSRKPSYKLQGVLNYMFESDQSHRLPQTLEYIHLLDRTRGTDFATTFSELARELGDCIWTHDFGRSPSL